MSPRDFIFALELSDEREFDTMLHELTDAVLAHVGYRAAAVEELRGILRRAFAVGSAGRSTRCEVRFRVHGGELHVSVACDGADEWRTTRPVP